MLLHLFGFVFLPGKSHEWRRLVGCSPWGRQESDTTERLHFHFSLSCIGEGNGNPLLCSCLENPREGGAWWAAIYEIAQSRTRLKRLGSSSSDKRVTLLPVQCVQSLSLSHVQSLLCPWDSPGKDTGVGCYALLQAWHGLPDPGRLPDPGTEPASPVLADWFFTTKSPGKSFSKMSHVILRFFSF